MWKSQLFWLNTHSADFDVHDNFFRSTDAIISKRWTGDDLLN